MPESDENGLFISTQKVAESFFDEGTKLIERNSAKAVQIQLNRYQLFHTKSVGSNKT